MHDRDVNESRHHKGPALDMSIISLTRAKDLANSARKTSQE
jgi:hypothetical protein